MWDCCSSTDAKQAGCRAEQDCCGREVGSPGCKVVCGHCHAHWGSPAPPHCIGGQHRNIVSL